MGGKQNWERYIKGDVTVDPSDAIKRRPIEETDQATALAVHPLIIAHRATN